MKLNNIKMKMNEPPEIVTSVHKTYLKYINESKLLIGITMLLLNVGSKYVNFNFTKAQEQMLRDGLAREILIFAMVFMGTRDIIYAILLTAAFKILSEFALNEKSDYCIIPEKFKKISSLIDTNNDGIISPEEEEKAIALLQKAEKNRERNLQGKFSSYLNNMNAISTTATIAN